MNTAEDDAAACTRMLNDLNIDDLRSPHSPPTGPLPPLPTTAGGTPPKTDCSGDLLVISDDLYRACIEYGIYEALCHAGDSPTYSGIHTLDTASTATADAFRSSIEGSNDERSFTRTPSNPQLKDVYGHSGGAGSPGSKPSHDRRRSKERTKAPASRAGTMVMKYRKLQQRQRVAFAKNSSMAARSVISPTESYGDSAERASSSRSIHVQDFVAGERAQAPEAGELTENLEPGISVTGRPRAGSLKRSPAVKKKGILKRSSTGGNVMPLYELSELKDAETSSMQQSTRGSSRGSVYSARGGVAASTMASIHRRPGSRRTVSTPETSAWQRNVYLPGRITLEALGRLIGDSGSSMRSSPDACHDLVGNMNDGDDAAAEDMIDFFAGLDLGCGKDDFYADFGLGTNPEGDGSTVDVEMDEDWGREEPEKGGIGAAPTPPALHPPRPPPVRPKRSDELMMGGPAPFSAIPASNTATLMSAEGPSRPAVHHIRPTPEGPTAAAAAAGAAKPTGPGQKMRFRRRLLRML